MNEKPLDLMSLIEGDLPFYDMTMPLFGGLGGNTGGPLGLSSDMLTSPATATSATTMLGAAKPSTEKVHSNSHADVGLAQEESVVSQQFLQKSVAIFIAWPKFPSNIQ